MTLTLVQRPPTLVVGLQIRTKPMSPEIPALWPRFVARIGEIPHPAEPRVSYGVIGPGSDKNQLDYLAAVSVSADGPLPEGMTRLVLPAGTYARFSFPLSKLGEGFGEIFQRALPESAYVQAPGPLFERYDEAFCPDDPNSAVEVWLPVAPKAT